MSPQKKALQKIQKLRSRIDVIDRKLLKILKDRFQMAEQIGKIKVAHALPIYQKARWQKLLEGRLRLAKKFKLNEKFSRILFSQIHREAVKIQMNLARKKKK